jgi:amidase
LWNRAGEVVFLATLIHFSKPMFQPSEGSVPPQIEDSVGAFLPGPRAEIAGAAEGPLAGLTFAVKDLYDVAGQVTGYGNPDWARTHPPAAATAPTALSLLQAGASLRGKTKTVELAYGLTGENIWYGTPKNPAAPERFPGGSSCGSAAAVAARLVDFAMGSDTGGSVRIPASYCGIYGIRPSWGSVNLTGCCPLGPSFDTAGWFASRASVLRRVGEVLVPPPSGGESALPGPLLKVQEAWVNAVPATAAALVPALTAAEQVMGGLALSTHLAPEGLDNFYEHFRCAQAEEAWSSLGAWIEATQPKFGPGVAERFAAAKALDPEKAAAGRAFRRVAQRRIRSLLRGGAVLVFPTSPCPAPLLTAGPQEQQAIRERTMGVTALAGLAGLCEVTLPVGKVDGAPVGLSLAAAPGRDQALLALAERIAGALGLPV